MIAKNILISEPNGCTTAFVPGLTPYKNSRSIPGYLLDGYFLQLEPRISCVAEKEIESAAAVKKEWLERGGCPIHNKGISGAGGFASLVFSEAEPNKLLNIFDVVNLAWIEDDFMDGDMSVPGSREGQDVALDSRNYRDIINQMKSKSFVKALNGDDEAVSNFQSYNNWTAEAIETNNLEGLKFKSLEEYLAKRLLSIGADLSNQLMNYTGEINLSEEQRAIVDPLLQAAYRLTILVNDLYSAEKEWLVHADLDRPGTPTTAIFIIMRTQNVSLGEAKDIAKQKCIALEQTFLQLRSTVMKNSNSIAPQIMKFVTCLQCVIAGTTLWHMRNAVYKVDPKTAYCPQPEHKINDLPRKIAAHGATNGYKENLKNGESKPISKQEVAAPVSVKHSDRPVNGVTTSNGQKAQSKSAKPWLAKQQNLPEEVVLEPFEYIQSMPSKKIRKLAIDALNLWYKVPQESIDKIDSVIDMLHASSLIIDDIEDDSPLRRGFPAVHMTFGTPQAINAANYLFVKCLAKAQEISPVAVEIFTDELRNLHLGQGYDLHWTFLQECPSEHEYIRMIDGKTGGLFRMACRLMRSEATQHRDLDVENLLNLMGRFFQIRDDYQNLGSTDYATAKGSLSDLDEGKYSFMLIHALNHTEGKQLKSLLQLRSKQGSLLPEQKNLIMKFLAKAKSMEYTLEVLEDLQAEIEDIIQELENRVEGEKNWMLRLIMTRLKVADPTGTPHLISK